MRLALIPPTKIHLDLQTRGELHISGAVIPQKLMSITTKRPLRAVDNHHDSARRDFHVIVQRTRPQVDDTHSAEDKTPLIICSSTMAGVYENRTHQRGF